MKYETWIYPMWRYKHTVSRPDTSLEILRLKDRIAALERKVKALTNPKPKAVAALRPEDV